MHFVLFSRIIRTCQGMYLEKDHSKGTDYIVGLVHGTSGLVFSLPSLWWIRKECLVRKIPPLPLVLSGYCLCLPSFHAVFPFRNAFNNSVSLGFFEN